VEPEELRIVPVESTGEGASWVYKPGNPPPASATGASQPAEHASVNGCI